MTLITIGGMPNNGARIRGGVNPYFCKRPYVLNLKSKSIYI